MSCATRFPQSVALLWKDNPEALDWHENIQRCHVSDGLYVIECEDPDGSCWVERFPLANLLAIYESFSANGSLELIERSAKRLRQG